MRKKHVKAILEARLQEQNERQQSIYLWVVQNTPLAFPKIFQPLFKKAMLKQWNRVMEFFIWAYSVQLRFAKNEQGQLINVAIFKKGELFDSMIKPENNVVEFPGGKTNVQTQK